MKNSYFASPLIKEYSPSVAFGCCHCVFLFLLLFCGSRAAAFIKRFFLLLGLRESHNTTNTHRANRWRWLCITVLFMTEVHLSRFFTVCPFASLKKRAMRSTQKFKYFSPSSSSFFFFFRAFLLISLSCQQNLLPAKLQCVDPTLPQQK